MLIKNVNKKEPIHAPKIIFLRIFNALISSETSNRFSLSDYFETAYTRTYDFLRKPSLSAQPPRSIRYISFSYETANLDAFCLIHTTKGIGKLFCDTPTQINAAYELTKAHLLY